MEQATLSPQSNRLIELCEAILAGQADADELATLLDEMTIGLDKARQDFIDQANKQGEHYLEQMQEEMEFVLQSFDEYQNGLDEIFKYIQGENVKFIKDGVEIIIEATNHILDYLTVYEAKSLQLGPTSFPILNMLILLTESFNKEEISEDEFRFMIYNATQFFEKIIDELEGYEGDQAPEAIEKLKEGYDKFVVGLDKMDEGAKAHNDLLIEDSLEIIRESQEIIKSGYTKFNDEMFLDGPTDSPYANLLIATIEGHKNDIFPKELLMENLKLYEDEIRSLRVDVEGLMSLPTENTELEGEYPRTEESLDTINEAIEEVKTYLQDNNTQHLTKAVEKLKKGVGLLKESQKIYDDIGEREGKTACIRCGHLNDPISKVCGKCNAVLPKIEGGPTMQSTFQVGEAGQIDSGFGQEFVMTENVKKVVDASADVRDGKITFEEYDNTLKWMEGLIISSRRELDAGRTTIYVESYAEEDREAATEQKELVDDTISLLREGLDEFLQGIAQLRQFGADSDVECLRQGLQTSIEASMKIYQVQKIGDIAEGELAKIEVEMAKSAEEEPQMPTDTISGSIVTDSDSNYSEPV
ncbi:MAG: hypothetical protein K8T10_08820 [Candidatus Eremiobacteraeota bacterium]|nr:hypothetical protein [Candidatus Eremiobacteraeota bacterium]